MLSFNSRICTLLNLAHCGRNFSFLISLFPSPPPQETVTRNHDTSAEIPFLSLPPDVLSPVSLTQGHNIETETTGRDFPSSACLPNLAAAACVTMLLLSLSSLRFFLFVLFLSCSTHTQAKSPPQNRRKNSLSLSPAGHPLPPSERRPLLLPLLLLLLLQEAAPLPPPEGGGRPHLTEERGAAGGGLTRRRRRRRRGGRRGPLGGRRALTPPEMEKRRRRHMKYHNGVPRCLFR